MAAFLRQTAYVILISGALLLALNLTVGPSLGVGPNVLLGLCCGIAGVIAAVAIEEIREERRYRRQRRERVAEFFASMQDMDPEELNRRRDEAWRRIAAD